MEIIFLFKFFKMIFNFVFIKYTNHLGKTIKTKINIKWHKFNLFKIIM